MNEQRLGAIDVVRGMAVLGVIATHCVYAVPSVGAFFFKFIRTGQFGVDVFFVVSGFVLCRSADRRIASSTAGSTWTFLVRRLLRLAPLYLLGIAYYTGIASRSYAGPPETSLVSLVGNVLLINGWQPGWENLTIPGGWSISAEAAFAVLLSFTFPYLTRTRAVCALWMMLGVFTIWGAPSLADYLGAWWGSSGGAESPWFVLYHLPTFLGGVLVWRLWNLPKLGGLSAPWRFTILLMAGAVMIGRSFGVGSEIPRFLAVGGAAAIGLFAALSCSAEGTISRCLAWVGRISYGSYLVHFALILPMEFMVAAVLPVESSAFVMFLLLFLSLTVLTLPIAWLLEQSVERAVRRWIRPLIL